MAVFCVRAAPALGRSAVRSTSQFGQEGWVIDLLAGKRNGYFLDVGASNGIDTSNTLRLEREYGWRGLCVEPNTRFFKELVSNRNCDAINTCLYDRVGELPFLESAGTLGGVIDDFDEQQLNHAIRAKRLRLDEQGRPPLVAKSAMTVAEALDLVGAPPVIDYWSLDVEGAELRLLQSFPYARYAFDVLTVEHNQKPSRGAIRRFLESRGYEFVTALFIDDCYVRSAAFPQRHSRSAVWRRARR